MKHLEFLNIAGIKKKKKEYKHIVKNVFTFFYKVKHTLTFPGDSVVKNPPGNAGDLGSIPGSGGSPGEGNSNPLEYPCLGNLMNKGAW